MAKLFLGTQQVKPTLYKNVKNNQNIVITENGTYIPDQGYTGFGNVTIAVPNETETLTITENGTYTATSGTIGFSEITVAVPKVFIFDELTVTDNGTYTAEQGHDGISKVNVDVAQNNLVKYGCNIDTFVGNTVNGVLQAPQSGGDLVFTDIKDLGDNSLYYTFYQNTRITSVSFPDLIEISGNFGMYGAFQYCSSLTSFDLSKLSNISSTQGMYQAFSGCTNLTSVDLSNLTTVSGSSGMYYAFYGCTGLTSVDLSNLTTVSGTQSMCRAFYNCTSLKTLSFPSLNSNSFGSYTNQFNYMLPYCTDVTVHFPSNLQSVIGSWSDVTSGFGGTNTTVLFDLPATT